MGIPTGDVNKADTLRTRAIRWFSRYSPGQIKGILDELHPVSRGEQ